MSKVKVKLKQAIYNYKKAKKHRDGLHAQFDCHLIVDAEKEVVKWETVVNTLRKELMEEVMRR